MSHLRRRDFGEERNRAMFDLWLGGWTIRAIGKAFAMWEQQVSTIVRRQIFAYARLHFGFDVLRRTEYRALKERVRDHAAERLAS